MAMTDGESDLLITDARRKRQNASHRRSLPKSFVENSEFRSIATLPVTVCRIRQIMIRRSAWESPELAALGEIFSSDAQRMPDQKDGNCMGDEGKAVGIAQAPAALLSVARKRRLSTTSPRICFSAAGQASTEARSQTSDYRPW